MASPAEPAASDRLILPLLLIAAVALAAGILLPVVEVTNLAIFASRFSIAEAAYQLLLDGQYLLGFVIAVFSVVFPFGKIVSAAVLYLRLKRTGAQPGRALGLLEFFGRWSSADVLLVAIAIVVAKTSGIANAKMEIGLWFFAGSIVLTGVALHRLRRATTSI